MSGWAIAGSLVSGLFGKSAADKASDAQVAVGNRQIDVAQENRAEDLARFDPFYTSGLNYQNALNYELLGGQRPMMLPAGMSIEEVQTQGPSTTETYMDGGGREGNEVTRTVPGEMLTSYSVGGQSFDTMGAAQNYLSSQGTEYGGYTKTPGYDFRLQQGTDAIEGSAAARGGLFSGNTAKGLAEYGQNYASNEYGNYLNRLTGQAGQGMNAAGMIATSGANTTGQVNNALSGIGNAQAAGAIGGANALTQGIGNALGAMQYQNMAQPSQMPTWGAVY